MDGSTSSHKHEGHVTAPRAGVEYLFGPFRLELASLRLWHGDDVVPLAPKAFDTLLLLVQHRDRLLLKDELLHSLWSDSYVSEDSLTQNITALRRALGDDASNARYIATVPRRGYRFVAPVIERSTTDPVAAPPAAPAPTPPAAAAVVEAPPHAAVPAGASRRLLWAALVVLFGIAIGATIVALRGTTSGNDSGMPPLRLTVDTPPGTRLLTAIVAPDGNQLALVAEDLQSRTARLWVRARDAGIAQPLTGTEGASHPFWSPDGAHIAFFAGSTLKRVALASGSVQSIAPTVGLTTSGGTWSTSGSILFANFRSGIFSVPASGGAVTAVTTLDGEAGEDAHRWPSALPDGKHFLYSVISSSPAKSGTYVGTIGSTDATRVLPDVGAMYAPQGYLLFVRERVLMAQAFDQSTLRLTGDPVALATDVVERGVNSTAAISSSANDLLTFSTHARPGAGKRMRLVWMNRAGVVTGEIKALTSLTNPSLSPDGRQVLAGSGADVWLIDLDREVPTRVVAGNTPLLSPDGRTIAFTSSRDGGVSNIFVRPVAGGVDTLLVRSGEHKIVNDWSRDGQYLIYATTNARTGLDLWMQPLVGDQPAAPIVATPANEFQAQLSPDGRWLAWASDESGMWEVYVQAFPGGGDKIAISTGGGSEPQWRRDGRELYYLSADVTMKAVEFAPGSPVRVKRAVTLFPAPVPGSGELYARRNHYTVTPDGQRFLINAGDSRDESVAVVAGWTSQLPSR
jgi:eukaryotic-like serine/threonine-protein kinase